MADLAVAGGSVGGGLAQKVRFARTTNAGCWGVIQRRALLISTSVAPLLRAHASATGALCLATKYRTRGHEARRTCPVASSAPVGEAEIMKPTDIAATNVPVSLKGRRALKCDLLISLMSKLPFIQRQQRYAFRPRPMSESSECRTYTDNILSIVVMPNFVM